jgi:hypothetical protein
MTQPGVGPITALAFALTIGDAGHCPASKQVASYLGLIPREHSSAVRARFAVRPPAIGGADLAGRAARFKKLQYFARLRTSDVWAIGLTKVTQVIHIQSLICQCLSLALWKSECGWCMGCS